MSQNNLKCIQKLSAKMQSIRDLQVKTHQRIPVSVLCEAAHSRQHENIYIRWFSKQHIRGCRGDGCNLLLPQTLDQNKKTNFSRRSCFDLPHAKNSGLWNVALAKAVPLRTATQPVWPFEVHCLANQPHCRPGRQPRLGFTGCRQTRGNALHIN